LTQLSRFLLKMGFVAHQSYGAFSQIAVPVLVSFNIFKYRHSLPEILILSPEITLTAFKAIKKPVLK
ncbi:hypothetical protein, partial [Providencia rettgeri]|uniref:hypothetical protein n=1 Tax=Providencia rettgeri TaxID=587 RepID=UPI001C9AAFC6